MVSTWERDMVIKADLIFIPGLVLFGIGILLLIIHDGKKELFGDRWGIWSSICFLLGIVFWVLGVFVIRWLLSD
jgi:cytochrome c oxidase assembly factor CtaG